MCPVRIAILYMTDVSGVRKMGRIAEIGLVIIVRNVAKLSPVFIMDSHSCCLP